MGKKVFTGEVCERLKGICTGIENCYEINFVEIGMEEYLEHFLVQSVSTIAVSKIVITVKTITAKVIFKSYPYIKREILWGEALWTSRFYANTVGIYASKDTIMRYIQNQGKNKDAYTKIYEEQPDLDFCL